MLTSQGAGLHDAFTVRCSKHQLQRCDIFARTCLVQAPGEDGQTMATPVGNASERLRMVITDSDTLQSQIRQHLFVTQVSHLLRL